MESFGASILSRDVMDVATIAVSEAIAQADAIDLPRAYSALPVITKDRALTATKMFATGKQLTVQYAYDKGKINTLEPKLPKSQDRGQ